MNTSKIAKQLAHAEDRSSLIEMIQTLLFLMRKFGKSLNEPAVREKLRHEFPLALALYDMLGRSKCTVSECQQLLVSVSRLMDHNHLDITSLVDTIPIEHDTDDTLSHSIAPVVGLSVIGKGKIYKRSLETDLMKIIN